MAEVLVPGADGEESGTARDRGDEVVAHPLECARDLDLLSILAAADEEDVAPGEGPAVV